MTKADKLNESENSGNGNFENLESKSLLFDFSLLFFLMSSVIGDISKHNPTKQFLPNKNFSC